MTMMNNGLVQAHVIVNDSRKWLEWGPVTQETDKTGRGELVLRLEAMP